jgi:eukaryotic-like serine/threonine-protein kinase
MAVSSRTPLEGPTSGSFRCSAIGNRSRSPKLRSPKDRPCSRRMARWIAFTSNEGGQPNVYVQPFPGPGAKSQVSRDLGSHPVWRADGRELFYLGADKTMMAVPIGAGRSLNAGSPQALFPANALLLPNQAYAVTKDGRRFLVNARSHQSSDTAPLTVVLNWTAALQK